MLAICCGVEMMQLICSRCEGILDASWWCKYCSASGISISTTGKPEKFIHGEFVDPKIKELEAKLEEKEKTIAILRARVVEEERVTKAIGEKLEAMELAGDKMLKALMGFKKDYIAQQNHDKDLDAESIAANVVSMSTYFIEVTEDFKRLKEKK